MFRNVLRLVSPVGRPPSQLELGHSGGRHLYITTATRHGAIAVALSPEQVAHLVEAAGAWLAERAIEARPYGRLFGAEQTPLPAPEGPETVTV